MFDVSFLRNRSQTSLEKFTPKFPTETQNWCLCLELEDRLKRNSFGFNLQFSRCIDIIIIIGGGGLDNQEVKTNSRPKTWTLPQRFSNPLRAFVSAASAWHDETELLVLKYRNNYWFLQSGSASRRSTFCQFYVCFAPSKQKFPDFKWQIFMFFYTLKALL